MITSLMEWSGFNSEKMKTWLPVLAAGCYVKDGSRQSYWGGYISFDLNEEQKKDPEIWKSVVETQKLSSLFGYFSFIRSSPFEHGNRIKEKKSLEDVTEFRDDFLKKQTDSFGEDAATVLLNFVTEQLRLVMDEGPEKVKEGLKQYLKEMAAPAVKNKTLPWIKAYTDKDLDVICSTFDAKDGSLHKIDSFTVPVYYMAANGFSEESVKYAMPKLVAIWEDMAKKQDREDSVFGDGDFLGGVRFVLSLEPLKEVLEADEGLKEVQQQWTKYIEGYVREGNFLWRKKQS